MPNNKLLQIADIVGEAGNNLADIYSMPADGLTMFEAWNIICAIKKMQKQSGIIGRWLNVLANLEK